jgi:hypothetical protein
MSAMPGGFSFKADFRKGAKKKQWIYLLLSSRLCGKLLLSLYCP